MSTKTWKPFSIIRLKSDNKQYIYIPEENVDIQDSLDKLIELPNINITLYVEPILKQLKNLGYIVKGHRYLSQKTGNMTTDLFIKI